MPSDKSTFKNELKTFKDLQFEFENGPNYRYERARIIFPNNFGVSVVRGTNTYGGPEGFWEVAVIKDYRINYDTPVTNDVIGWCTEEDVTNIMKQVQELDPQEDN